MCDDKEYYLSIPFTLSNERTAKCPVCGKPYKIINFCPDDQSACHKCVKEAERNMKKWKREEPYKWDKKYLWVKDETS